jgi:predicted RNA-binding protein with TRAM domain
MKKLSLFALSALVGTGVVLGTSPQLPVAAATPSSATLLVTGTAGSANSAVGDSGLGQAWGVDTTLVSSTRWTVFESSASNLVANDTNNASDIFVTNGTTITRLSVSASGAEGSVSANSFDPTICGTGRKVVFTTENEWDEVDANGAEDVYVIDRDADANGVMDEFSRTGGVTTSIVSVSYNADTTEYDISYLGANSGVISDDCSKVAFVTDNDFTLDDLNFGPDVYVRDLASATTALTWASAYATNGSTGGGYLPAISSDGSSVVVSTESTDLVSDSGTVGGLVLRTASTGSYLTRTPAGVASTGTLADSERPAAMTPDGKCVAFKADRGYDLLTGSTGPAQGIFLWDNRTGTPVISLVSKDSGGTAASSASNPRISDDCRFVAYESNDEYLSSKDTNGKTDVFLYDTSVATTDLVSSLANGNSADGNSSVAALDWNSTTQSGVVLITSNASSIGGASGAGSLNLFSVPFSIVVTAASAPTITTVTAGVKKLTVAFTAPSSNGGAAITNYEYSTNNGTTWKAFSPADTSSPLVISKLSTSTKSLKIGTTYRVKIRAVNSAGSGAASAAKSGKPANLPGAPTIGTVTASTGKLTVAFKAPSTDGGAAITNYEYSTNNGTTWKAFNPADKKTPLVITKVSNKNKKLVKNTTYQVKIRAVNSAGSGAASTAKSIKAK